MIYPGVLEEDGEYEVVHFGAVLEQDSFQCSASVRRERQRFVSRLQHGRSEPTELNLTPDLLYGIDKSWAYFHSQVWLSC